MECHAVFLLRRFYRRWKDLTTHISERPLQSEGTVFQKAQALATLWWCVSRLELRTSNFSGRVAKTRGLTLVCASTPHPKEWRFLKSHSDFRESRLSLPLPRVCRARIVPPATPGSRAQSPAAC